MNYPEKQNFFQIGLMILFGFFAVGGIITLSIYRATQEQMTIAGSVVIWGPVFENDAFNQTIQALADEEKSFKNVSYVGKNPATLYSELLEAIATGNSPDLIILNPSGLLMLKNKLFPISFETLPKSAFEETFVHGAKIFMFEDATYAYPLMVDPLVLYWNKHLFANAAIATVPKEWDTFVSVIPRLSKIAGGADLTQGAVAFGEYDNVLHAKEILSTLLMQTGFSLVSYDRVSKSFVSDLLTTPNGVKTETALTFYTSFSNPAKLVYSWNKTFDRSREAFSANKVAMYGGFVSEEKVLTEINPNLNYSMAVWPQSNNTVSSLTYGNFHGIGVLKSSKNPSVALYVAKTFASKSVNASISKLAGLPSVRNDILSVLDSTDPHGAVKVQSAIIAQSWLEPAPKSSVEEYYRNAINGVVSGSRSPGEGMVTLHRDISALLEQYNVK